VRNKTSNAAEQSRRISHQVARMIAAFVVRSALHLIGNKLLRQFFRTKGDSMSEFQQAEKIWSAKNLGLHCIENSTKTLSFVGTVPMNLSYYRRDGQPLTDEDVKGILQCGAGLFRKTIGSRVWLTREDAVNEAKSLGYEVAQ
jgi:hypothetical protein